MAFMEVNSSRRVSLWMVEGFIMATSEGERDGEVIVGVPWLLRRRIGLGLER